MFRRSETPTIEKFVRALSKDAAMRGRTWDRLFVWTEFGDGVQQMSGFSYDGDVHRWLVPESDEVETLLQGLRVEGAEADPRGQCDALVVSLKRGGQPRVIALYENETDEWRITPSTSMTIMQNAKSLW